MVLLLNLIVEIGKSVHDDSSAFCVCSILSNNRPYDLDEAMHRRIMIAIEFRQPDHLLRKAIWESHIPQAMKLADDVNLVSISLQL